jgi:phosphotransferase system HPr-like phosphotransfer protein
MKIARSIVACFLLSLGCAYGQMIVISARPKDPEVKPEQRTATIVHYEKMRVTARSTIRVLALALQNTDGPRVRLNEAIDNEQDIVDWANWCILALRDKTDEAKACVFQPDPK